MELHPQSFPKLKRILERFATGQFSLTAIQREMAKAGLVGPQNKKPLPISSISHLLANPFYHSVFSVFFRKGVIHQGSHVPMLTKQRWDEIQRARINVAKPRKRRGVQPDCLKG